MKKNKYSFIHKYLKKNLYIHSYNIEYYIILLKLIKSKKFLKINIKFYLKSELN